MGFLESVSLQGEWEELLCGDRHRYVRARARHGTHNVDYFYYYQPSPRNVQVLGAGRVLRRIKGGALAAIFLSQKRSKATLDCTKRILQPVSNRNVLH